MKEFFTPEVINTIFSIAIIPMLAVITKFVICFLKSKAAELEQKIENEKLKKYIIMAEDAIETAVISVNQTFVDEMKKQGTFDQAAMEKSFNLAKDKALGIIGPFANNILKNSFYDVNEWLDSKLEFYVNKNKKE